MKTLFPFLINLSSPDCPSLFIPHIILVPTEFKDCDLQFIQIDIKYCIQNFQMVYISSDTLHICVFFLSNQFFSNHDKNIFLSTKVFFLLQRIFGDIFLNNYLDFPETNPIVQYLKFYSETLYDYSKIRFLFSVCNFLVHDKCLKSTTNPCVSVAATIVKVSWRLIIVF